MKKITILGSTGSIGRNCLEILSSMPDRFKVHGLAGRNNLKELKLQVEQFHPKMVVVWDVEKAKQFKKFFEAIAKAFNEGTDKKPIFLTAKGLPIIMVMKLVATYASQGKALGFDSYVKEGFIQKFLMTNGQLVTSLKIKGNETVELSAGKVAKTMATTDAAPAGFSQDVAPEVLAALNQTGQ